jgi:rubrerythrin
VRLEDDKKEMSTLPPRTAAGFSGFVSGLSSIHQSATPNASSEASSAAAATVHVPLHDVENVPVTGISSSSGSNVAASLADASRRTSGDQSPRNASAVILGITVPVVHEIPAAQSYSLALDASRGARGGTLGGGGDVGGRASAAEATHLMRDIDEEEQELLLENRRLMEVRTCKVCMDRDVDTVFLPCGHLVACQECSPKLKNCPICRTFIRGTVKTFLS